MAATRELVRQEFRAALMKVAKEGRLEFTDWEESKLFDAMGHVNAEQYEEAFQALINFNRAPTNKEAAAITHTRERLSVGDIHKAFDRIFQSA